MLLAFSHLKEDTELKNTYLNSKFIDSLQHIFICSGF